MECGDSSPLSSRASVLWLAHHCRKNRHGARRVTTFKRKNRHGARRVVSTAPSACGWLRGTSRTSPGPPRRWRRPVRLQGTSARGRGFAAYLPGCARQLFIVRCAHYARGASLTAFGFVTTVPRYLPRASNSLTFVRGADRACCAPRKWLCRPTNACLCQSPHAPRRGIGVRTRQRHLAARVNGFADQPMLACASRRAPPEGALACAPGSGTLPPARPRRA